MPSLRWYLVIFAAVTIALVGGTVLIEQTTIDRLLYDDAVSTGRTWTEYVRGHVGDDLDSITAGNPPSAQSQAFFDQVKQVGSVFLYKIYDATGALRLASADLPEGEDAEDNLAAHNESAAEAVEKGEPAIEVKAGEPPSRPAFFAEAYVPVIRNGKVQAVVETYVDQTAKRAEFHSAFIDAATKLGLLIGLAFAAPAAAWYFRKSEQQRAEARIHYLANFDPLSGVANRQRLTDGLAAALAARGGTGLPIAVYCIDIDRFKDINDLLGIESGDKVLRAVADRLTTIADKSDIVARLGGDEFAIVKTEAENAAAAEDFARRVSEEIKAPLWIAGQEVRLTVSVGVALAPAHGREAARLIKSAELALSKAKKEGAGRYRVFSPDLDAELYGRLKLEQAIFRATENEGFLLYFQPLFAASDGRINGFEALLRLPDGHGGFIPPSEFIPVAEKMGLISRIGAWVLTEACTTAMSWPEPISVAVNLSPAQFAAGDVVELVAYALKASGLRPDRLELEITESLLLQDTDAVLSQLAELKALGTAIVMDDFGTGYSSLGYLWRFPFDKIKIDRSFLRAFDNNDAAAAKIIRTIVALGRALGVRVNAEGVETERHAEFIRSLDCDELQGFYFGVPMPVADLPALILSNFGRRLHRALAAPEPAKVA
jgi:diguanylate cyclase (GGDEF)-like protein